VVLESEPKDSSAAIGLAAAILVRREPDVIIGSFAADHVIPTRGFRRAVIEAGGGDGGRLHRDNRHHAGRMQSVIFP
jgi:mannose-1-phosphate guanylyltransferase